MAMDDTEATDAGDGRWMTYDELAAVRQIGRRAAIRLAQRHRLRRQPGNDGLARVWVPTDMASSSPRRPTPPVTDADDNPNVTPSDVATPFHAHALAALEDALAALREAQEGEIATLREMIGGLRDTVARAENRAVNAEQRAGVAEANATALRDRLNTMQEQLADAHAALETAAAADARTKQAEQDRERAEAGWDAERASAAALRNTIDELKAGQTLMADMHAAELTAAHGAARTAEERAEALGRAEDARRARGLVARLRAAWRGE
jgi:hypothetical protein